MSWSCRCWLPSCTSQWLPWRCSHEHSSTLAELVHIGHTVLTDTWRRWFSNEQILYVVHA
jgi:hypothetical protein